MSACSVRRLVVPPSIKIAEYLDLKSYLKEIRRRCFWCLANAVIFRLSNEGSDRSAELLIRVIITSSIQTFVGCNGIGNGILVFDKRKTVRRHQYL
jgi:hypothetical protein